MAIKADVKKTLKTCRADVYLHAQGDYVTATLRVEHTEGAYKGDPFVRVEAQANDLRRRKGSHPASTNPIRNLPDVSGFYAATIESRQGLFGGFSSPYENPERAGAFFALVRDTIEKFNLSHKHPHCELSQILSALVLLDVTEGGWQVQQEGGGFVPLADWKREREAEASAHCESCDKPGATKRQDSNGTWLCDACAAVLAPETPAPAGEAVSC
jgi:hypothetical protein